MSFSPVGTDGTQPASGFTPGITNAVLRHWRYRDEGSGSGTCTTREREYLPFWDCSSSSRADATYCDRPPGSCPSSSSACEGAYTTSSSHVSGGARARKAKRTAAGAARQGLDFALDRRMGGGRTRLREEARPLLGAESLEQVALPDLLELGLHGTADRAAASRPPRAPSRENTPILPLTGSKRGRALGSCQVGGFAINSVVPVLSATRDARS